MEFIELQSVQKSMKNLESDKTSLNSVAQKRIELWDFKNVIESERSPFWESSFLKFW